MVLLLILYQKQHEPLNENVLQKLKDYIMQHIEELQVFNVSNRTICCLMTINVVEYFTFIKNKEIKVWMQY